MHTISPHARAGRALARRIPAALARLLCQLAVRAAALCPLWAALLGFHYGQDARCAPLIGAGLSLALYVLLAMPFRCKMRAWLLARAKGEAGAALPSFSKALRLSLRRAAAVAPFMLPLLLYAGGFYYLLNIASATMLPRLISGAGKLLGGGLVLGAAVWAAVFVLALIPALLAWRRTMGAEFLSGAAVRDVPKTAAALVRARRAPLRRVTLLNALIALPAVCAAVLALWGDLAAKLTGSVSRDLFIVLSTVTGLGFSPAALQTACLFFAALYLPFVLWRKGALAAVLADGEPHG